MKITLSKSQWEKIGKETGWIKQSQFSEEYPKKCPECRGNKFIIQKLRNPRTSTMVEHTLPCDTCDGKGYITIEDIKAQNHRDGIAPCPRGHDKKDAKGTNCVKQSKQSDDRLRPEDKERRDKIVNRIKELEETLKTEKDQQAIDIAEGNLKRLKSLIK